MGSLADRPQASEREARVRVGVAEGLEVIGQSDVVETELLCTAGELHHFRRRELFRRCLVSRFGRSCPSPMTKALATPHQAFQDITRRKILECDFTGESPFLQDSRKLVPLDCP